MYTFQFFYFNSIVPYNDIVAVELVFTFFTANSLFSSIYNLILVFPLVNIIDESVIELLAFDKTNKSFISI